MRKVQICNSGFYSGKGHNEPKDFQEGHFHEWALCGNTEEGIEKYALVELPDGTIKEVLSHKIKFLSKE